MMARATDRFQLTVMRCNLLQKCGIPEFATFSSCTPAKIQFYLDRLAANTVNIKSWHHVSLRTL